MRDTAHVQKMVGTENDFGTKSLIWKQNLNNWRIPARDQLRYKWAAFNLIAFSIIQILRRTIKSDSSVFSRFIHNYVCTVLGSLAR